MWKRLGSAVGEIWTTTGNFIDNSVGVFELTNNTLVEGIKGNFIANVLLTGMVFAAMHDMNAYTDNHIVHTQTDAKQYGVNVEAAKSFAINDYLKLGPSLGLRYMMLDIDNIFDNAGISASFDKLHCLEAELGAKIEYLFCHNGHANRIYVKPSAIQTFSDGGKTVISGLEHSV